MNTQTILSTGSLPGIYTETDPREKIKTLQSYAATYLKEEIQAEALTRNIEGFSRFLFVTAHYSGQFLDISKLASEAHIPRQTATRFFEILEDTLLINRCEAFSTNDKKRLIKHPKYFFFDTGVLNALLGNFEVSGDRIGNLFEHLFFNQLINSAKGLDVPYRISTYRTEHGAEVDFIVETNKKSWAVELKASHNIGIRDLRSLKNFMMDHSTTCQPLVAYLGTVKKNIRGIPILPWQMALKEMKL